MVAFAIVCEAWRCTLRPYCKLPIQGQSSNISLAWIDNVFILLYHTARVSQQDVPGTRANASSTAGD